MPVEVRQIFFPVEKESVPFKIPAALSLPACKYFGFMFDDRLPSKLRFGIQVYLENLAFALWNSHILISELALGGMKGAYKRKEIAPLPTSGSRVQEQT